MPSPRHCVSGTSPCSTPQTGRAGPRRANGERPSTRISGTKRSGTADEQELWSGQKRHGRATVQAKDTSWLFIHPEHRGIDGAQVLWGNQEESKREKKSSGKPGTGHVWGWVGHSVTGNKQYQAISILRSPIMAWGMYGVYGGYRLELDIEIFIYIYLLFLVMGYFQNSPRLPSMLNMPYRT